MLVVLFALSACVKADKNKIEDPDAEIRGYSLVESLQNNNNKALFLSGKVKLEEKQFGFDGQDSWKQYNRVYMKFMMCGLQDTASRGRIIGSKFHVRSELGEALENPRVVNQDGCLEWVQIIPNFNFLAPSNNLVLHFEVDSLGGGLGKIIRRVGFNPWDMHRKGSQSSGFEDMTNIGQREWKAGHWVVGANNVIDALKGEYTGNGDSKVRLEMKSVSVEPSEQDRANMEAYHKSFNELSEAEKQRRLEYEERHLRESGIKFQINLKGAPFVRVTDATDVSHDIDLKDGKFRVNMTLVAEGVANDGKRYILAQDLDGKNLVNASSMTWEMTPQGLLASVPMVLRTNTNYGQVKMAVKIDPVGLKGVEPFMAVYNLGQYDSWVKRQSPLIDTQNYTPKNQIEYSQFIETAESPSSDIATARDAELFYFSPLVMRFVRIMPGESATDRTLQYSVTTCVTHGLYGNQVAPGLQFDIATEDKGKRHLIRRQTNEKGCLTWFGFLSHKYYHKEVLERKTAEVTFVGMKRLSTQEEANYQGTSDWRSFINKYNKEFVYYMNPWDEKWTFGWDERDMPKGYPAEVEQQKKNAPESKMFIADFKYETMGFRYEIDKYMKLKVKKAVLLKAYPYVLKYNSIVLGRNGTEKLRDGVYLMKVALQKDYLDPAAKGVRIYDAKNPTSFLYKDTPLDGPSGSYPYAVAENKPIAQGQEDQDEYISPRELGEGHKEYISIQKKLVRVLGGMIITPVEFDIKDLRLMRIRNQFFIQLQTIDEHKLRLATIIDQTLLDMQTKEVQEKYAEIFKALDDIQDIDDERIRQALDEQHRDQLDAEALASLDALTADRADAEKRLYTALGFGDMDFNSPEFRMQKQFIADKLAEINRYRALGFTSRDRYSNAAQTFYRNEKRQIIDRMIERFGDQAEEVINTDWTQQTDEEYLESTKKDPMMRYFYLGSSKLHNRTLQRILDYRLEKAGEGLEKTELTTLRSADFTESPLTPSFNLDLLLNDGAGDDKSGLPARTFVGPLTFVHNTNGSSLRPTDILEEAFCPTATCTENEMFRQGVPTPTQPKPTKEGVDPMPEVDVLRVTGLDVDGKVSDNPIYLDGDSKNFKNETNKYYGSLRAYSGKTFEDYVDENGVRRSGLISDKRKSDERYIRQMEEGSQIINFVRTMGLKHVLLNQDKSTNFRSTLKEIDHDCAQDRSIPITRLNECFVEATSTEHSMESSELMEMLNERKGPRAWRKGMVMDNNERAYWSTGRSHFGNNRSYGEEGEKITSEDMRSLLTWGWKKSRETMTATELKKEEEKESNGKEVVWPLEDGKRRLLFHRMCFALSQKFFNKRYYDREPSKMERLKDSSMLEGREGYNNRVVHELEELCHKFTDNLFESNPGDEVSEGINTRIHPPVVFERKARVYDTTGRYVYRGGKSLNINLSASFSLSHNEGFSKSSTISFKPWDLVEDLAGAVGKVAKSIVGAVGFSVSYSKSEGLSRSDGTTVSSGTFLVSQQASFILELKEYERCMVVRFGPKMIKRFIESSRWLKEGFDGMADNEKTEIDTQGLMICEGKVITEPLPVNEKYYYFTQHFTEGDMLDTADMHNHPWLLQLRGYRDFQTFVSMIGAKEVDYVDQGLFKTMVTDVSSDLQSMNAKNSNEELAMKLVDKENDMNWPLNTLGDTYFNVLPTFPGIYTFTEGANLPEWPYDNNEPGVALEDARDD